MTVFHHVLADGIGGLAVLAGLVDGATGDLTVLVASSRPHRTWLLIDATAVPTVGDPLSRLAETARRRPPRGEAPVDTAVLVNPALRLLAAVRLLHWITDHQRMVNGFVTNLRGPEERLSFLGAEVHEVIPVSGTAGNVTVAFAALSYAGSLVITLVADPDACPDLVEVRDDLQSELEGLIARSGG